MPVIAAWPPLASMPSWGQEPPPSSNRPGPFIRKDGRRTGGRFPPSRHLEVAAGQGDVTQIPGGGYKVEVVPATPGGVSLRRSKTSDQGGSLPQETRHKRDEENRSVPLLPIVIGVAAVLLCLVGLLIACLRRGEPVRPG